MRWLLRDLLRQRLRTALTVAGVALGIFTLVALGGLGEHFRAMVEDAKGYAGGLVRLYTKTNKAGINPGITPEDLARVRAHPGVAQVCPTVTLFFDGFDLEDDPLTFMTPRPLVEGVPAAAAEALRGRGMHLLSGRWLREGDLHQAMLVEWLARRRGLKPGDEVTIRHLRYEVVGIYEAPDTPMVGAGLVPYERLNKELIQPEVESARRFLARLTRGAPGLGQGGLGLGGLAAQAPPALLDRLAKDFAAAQAGLFRVYEIVPRDRSRAGTLALASELRAQLPELAVIDPARIEERMERAVAIFLVITLIVTVLSTVVGGLLIVNTMAMAVIERRKEIAIRAALGATPGQLAGELVLESAALALVGAALGIDLAALAIALAEPHLLAMLESGSALFRITPRLLLLAVGYALVLGVLAGGVPAARAARVDPAITLREL
ncbi:MAG: ABC transporter permease [Planctomycetota bacterium]